MPINRGVWAVQHGRGVSLLEAISGRVALEVAKKLFGPGGGPYKVPRNQEQEIVAAKLMGTKVLTRKIQKHAVENTTLLIQRPRNWREVSK